MATVTEFSKPVQRVMEFCKVEIDTDFCILYARMQGEKNFNWGFYSHKAAENVVKTIQHPSDMKRSWQPMPHAKARSGKGSHSKASDFRGYLSALPSDVIADWRERGVSFDYAKNYDFKANWGEGLPEGWSMVWWCGYDHTMLDRDGRLVNLPQVELACSSSYNMDKLDELVATDARFSWADGEHHYVPHNGMSNNLVIHFTDEQYEDRLMKGHMSGLYQILPFLGLDYKEYEAAECDDDDDRW